MKKRLVLLASILLIGLISGCSTTPAGPAEKSTPPATVEPSTPPPVNTEIEYPKKAIKFICSFAAGGGNDTMLRTLARDVEGVLGVPVVVENKTGGGGWVGWDYVAKSDPDGYTVGYIVSTNLITGMMNPSTQRSETLDSFEYIIEHVEEPMCVAVRADDDRFNSIEELAEYSKTTQLTAPSLGVAGVVHIAGLRLIAELGIDMRFVQFEGASEALTATLGGHIDVYLAKVTEVSGPRDEGQLKVLAVLADERSDRMPDVPTIEELYGLDMSVASVRGLVVPAGTDPRIVSKLSDALETAMNKPEHIEVTKAQGVVLKPVKEDAFKELLQKEEATLEGMKSLFGW